MTTQHTSREHQQKRSPDEAKTRPRDTAQEAPEKAREREHANAQDDADDEDAMIASVVSGGA